MENNLMDLFDKRPLSALPVGEPTNAVFTEAKSGKEVEIPVLAWQVASCQGLGSLYRKQQGYGPVARRPTLGR